MKKINVLSLFSGAGGLDIGFVKTGFNIIASVELQKDFCASLQANVGTYYEFSHKIFCEDIAQFNPNSILDQKIDFIIGGPPCQSFSAAGRRAGGVYGINDIRGSLFWHYCRIIKDTQPTGFLFENVRGILQSNNKKDWDLVLQSFSELGYKIKYRVFDAADYGVPQHRERVVIVGYKSKSDFYFPRPTHGPDSSSSQKHVGVYDALKDIDNPDEEIPPYGGKYGELVKLVPPGMNYLHFTENMGCEKPLFAWRSKFSDFLYKVHPEQPCKTIVASQGRYGGPFHWRGRKMTIEELKRIQSFPDDYKIIGSYNIAAKQIGNSVAPLFAEQLSKSVKNTIFNDKNIFVELLEDDAVLSFDKRKSRKAQITRESNRKKSINNDQLSLFDNNDKQNHLDQSDFRVVKYSSPRKISESGDYGTFKINSTLKNEEYKIFIKKNRGNFNLKLQLFFHETILNAFNTIHCEMITDTIYDYCIMWDIINYDIRSVTSYNSIEPLYGHFTEPYPRFDMKFQYTGTPNPLSRFIEIITNFKILKELRNLDELNKIFNIEPILQVKILREHGFDIRVHETNRTIPKGFYKICYPFTIDIETITFIAWREKGKHKTADFSHFPLEGIK